MVIHDLDRFNNIAEACGNRYVAIQLIAKAARSLGQATRHYSISESKLLEWIITGSCPYSQKSLERRQVFNEKLDDVMDILCYVTDQIVIDEVTVCYRNSIRHRKLTLCKREDISKHRVNRINILLRMIWYNFKED